MTLVCILCGREICIYSLCRDSTDRDSISDEWMYTWERKRESNCQQFLAALWECKVNEKQCLKLLHRWNDLNVQIMFLWIIPSFMWFSLCMNQRVCVCACCFSKPRCSEGWGWSPIAVQIVILPASPQQCSKPQAGRYQPWMLSIIVAGFHVVCSGISVLPLVPSVGIYVF